MSLSKVMLRCQIVAYVTGLVLSLFIILPMITNLYKFEYRCLLFAHVTWSVHEANSVQWGSIAYCGYVIAVGVVMLLVCAVQIYRSLKILYSGDTSSFLSAFLEALGCILLTALSMYAAVVLTLGFMVWCNGMVERYSTCQDAGGEQIDNNNNIDTMDFYSDINTAQISTWAVFSTCVGLAVFSVVKVCYLHRLANIPMALRGERRPLLNESSRSTPSQPAARQ